MNAFAGKGGAGGGGGGGSGGGGGGEGGDGGEGEASKDPEAAAKRESRLAYTGLSLFSICAVIMLYQYFRQRGSGKP